ncbi:MAG: peptide chain release factor N(5)-glutamine methyltransferase [Ferruginibacter sp.]
MTFTAIYRNSLQELQKIYSPGEAETITKIIFEYFAHLSRSDMIKDPARQASKLILHDLTKSLKELMQYKPVQYITGEAFFCGLKLKVTEAVLIPRPETEELALFAKEFIQDGNRIIDIGTGSGCIAIALKKYKETTLISAVDISHEALHIAELNAKEQNCDIDFIQMDFLDERKLVSLGNFDLIVSNPPYIPEKEKQLLDRNVRDHEPHTALFVMDDDAIVFYRMIAQFGKHHLNENGKIMVETHELYAGKVAAEFIKHGFSAEIRKDMFDKERMVIAQR